MSYHNIYITFEYYLIKIFSVIILNKLCNKKKIILSYNLKNIFDFKIC
jgi:hypothetical protein